MTIALDNNQLMYRRSFGKLRSDLEETMTIQGILASSYYGIAAIVATFFTLFGLPLAIIKINKIKNAKEADKLATDRTKKLLQKNAILSDLPSLEETIPLIKEYIRSKDYKNANKIVRSLRLSVADFINLEQFNTKQDEIQKHVKNLSLMEDQLDKKLDDQTHDIRQECFSRPLFRVEEFIRISVGAEKYSSGEDDQNDT